MFFNWFSFYFSDIIYRISHLIRISMNLSIREMQESNEKLIVDYFINSNPEYLENLGADLSKIPMRKD